MPFTPDPQLYPFESHYATVNGQRMHYLDEGPSDAPVLVMVHGNPSWSFYFRELVKEFSREYRCIVPDHIGMGLSERSSEARYTYTLASRVDDLEALLEQLGLTENLTFVVHDWGGMIGFAVARRHPEWVSRFVVFNTAAFRLPATRSFHWPLWFTRTPLGGLLTRGANAFSCGAAVLGCTRRRMPAAVRAMYTGPYDSWENRLSVLRFVQDIPLQEGDRAYSIVKDVEEHLYLFSDKPVLICWGAKDFVFDDHFLNAWKRFFPRAEVHRFADAGHYVVEDAPDLIVPLMRDFLARATAAATNSAS